MMQRSYICSRSRQEGFSLLEMMFATIILLVGLVAIAQLVPASMLLNNRNRLNSSALVSAQRDLDQMLDQPLSSTSFTDALLNPCNLRNPTPMNTIRGTAVLLVLDNPPCVEC